MQKINNLEVRQAIERKRLHYYEVANALNINPCTLSRWLEKDLPEERKNQILEAIKSIEY
jgi:transcriptional regulator with XRE-family HTH domain